MRLTKFFNYFKGVIKDQKKNFNLKKGYLKMNDYQLPEPVYFDTPQRLWCIIDSMPESVIDDFKLYSNAENKNAALDHLIAEKIIYDVDFFIFWAETYARLNSKKELK